MLGQFPILSYSRWGSFFPFFWGVLRITSVLVWPPFGGFNYVFSSWFSQFLSWACSVIRHLSLRPYTLENLMRIQPRLMIPAVPLSRSLLKPIGSTLILPLKENCKHSEQSAMNSVVLVYYAFISFCWICPGRLWVLLINSHIVKNVFCAWSIKQRDGQILCDGVGFSFT